MVNAARGSGERVSYDVMTPSAARAVFEAIMWKPAIRWEIDRIEVLRPIQLGFDPPQRSGLGRCRHARWRRP